ncbi:unnamed protein product [Adineta steineri]|uniref:snRNA-activating protein complex subunit 4 n=2 Tax=Adineta steineri TaxID=433720 RepID=A0A818NII1_9BILA|nr:unnamed protein product [Adineta steineri]
MTSTVSSIFSTNDISNHHKFIDDDNLYELFSSSLPKNTPLFTSVFNNCYKRALESLNIHLGEIDIKPTLSLTTHVSSYNVTEDDFDATVFPDRSLTPSSTTICQWRHEQFLNDKFLQLLIPLVAESMHSIVLHWIELELSNEEERQRKNDIIKNDLKNKIYELKTIEQSINELKSMKTSLNNLKPMRNSVKNKRLIEKTSTNINKLIEKISVDVNRLYAMSENSKDILIEQVDWKLIGTKMRSEGGFKYFDENSLKRMWIHRCQYGPNNSWSDNDDEILNQLVEQYGYGKWIEIAQHEIFQKKKKSAFMCAQRYMTKTNKLHAKTRFTKPEKELLLSIYKHRCSVMKDYRFCLSYAAYRMGDRCIREITHAWTYLNPDIQKGSFSPEEDALLLQHVTQTTSVCWSTVASTHLPSRSAVQCRQRYFQLIKPRSTQKTKKTHEKINKSRVANHIQWLQKQPIYVKNFFEQFYTKSRLTRLQKSIIEMNSNKIQSLMELFYNNPDQPTKCLTLRELILELNTPTVTVETIYTKFVNILR